MGYCSSYKCNQCESCIRDHLATNCGQTAAEIFLNLIHFGSMKLLQSLCLIERYDQMNGSKCNRKKFEIPAISNRIPKGLKSDSIVSYLFSYSCPNLGWGSDDSRDY